MYQDIHCANCLHWDERFDPQFTRNGYCKKYKKPVISLSTCMEWIYYNYPKRQNITDISTEVLRKMKEAE